MDYKQMEQSLKAASDETRMLILKILIERGIVHLLL